MKKINVLISTFFGYGYLTKMPGTVTSLVTTIFVYIAYEHLGYTDLKFSIIFLLFYFSILFMQLKMLKLNLKIKILDKLLLMRFWVKLCH